VRVTVRVPATSANLGPGFDCFGLALDLCNEVTVDTEAEPGVSWEGEGADELPTDGSDMVSRAMRVIAERQASELPSLALHGVNRIPLERGLGSSSSAAVAGAAIGRTLLEVDDPMNPTLVFADAVTLEGHEDNAAAATHGGLVLVGDRILNLEPHPSLRPVALVPEHLRVATDEARRALPDTVSRRDAVFNVSHAALAVWAMTRDPSLLSGALWDRLHEDVRLASVPEARDLRDRLRNDHIPACVSGSGPSLLSFETDEHPIPEDLPPGWRVMRLNVRLEGVEIHVEA
jgi:homoserine kinase